MYVNHNRLKFTFSGKFCFFSDKKVLYYYIGVAISVIIVIIVYM